MNDKQIEEMKNCVTCMHYYYCYRNQSAQDNGEVAKANLFKQVEEQGCIYYTHEDSVIISQKEYDALKTIEKYHIKSCGKNSVVLTNEELKDMVSAKMKCINKVAILTHKETVKEVLKAVFTHITTREVWEKLQHDTWLSAGGNFTANKHIWDLLLEPIAEQCGVKIEEQVYENK